MNKSSEEFARVMISMGEFMAQGMTYEETYRHAQSITQNPELSQLWKEMMAMAGVETIWIKGGRTFLEVDRALHASGQPSVELQGRAFLKLVVTGIRLGLKIDVAVRGAQEIADNPELRNFMEEAPSGLAAACRKHPGIFSSELVHTLEADEKSPGEFPYNLTVEKLIL